MNWIINNPWDAFFLFWSVLLKPCFITCAVILILCVVLARITSIRRELLRCLTWVFMALSVVSIGGLRIYGYLNPSLNTESDHENYSASFNDVQSVQIKAAEKYGVKPLKDREDAGKAVLELNLKHLRSCRNYQLAPMGHSIPYLTSNAAELLDMIGKNFRDSLTSHNIASHKIVVTSVLRTDADVEKLMKHNSVAVRNSAHRYATTFDISYTNFIPGGFTASTDRGELKKILAEVLSDLRQEKLCYVKYEKSQSCFHITVRR